MATMTDPDCLGPMDPGASVSLEGIVWHETENGERRRGGPFNAVPLSPIYPATLLSLTSAV